MNAIRSVYGVIVEAFGSHPEVDFSDVQQLGVVVGTLLRRLPREASSKSFLLH